MSHFTVLVIGENPEEHLKPFDENLRIEFNDKTEEYKKEYETETTKEFYCESSSSWGQQITEELFNTLKSSKIGRIVIYDVKKIGGLGYFKKGGKYRGYHTIEDGKRCKGDQWFEVDHVIETTHPDSNICFEGKISVRKIAKPKVIALKDKYPVYEDYLSQWHGVTDTEVQGYSFNPKAKWDWYQLGGRWSGFFKLKSGAKGNLGKQSWANGDEPIKFNHVDQAKKGDVDFESMDNEKFEELSTTYDKYEEALKNGEITSAMVYFTYGIENTSGNRDTYIPETREQYLNRCAAISTFAVLKDGEWYEKGEMGWWGCVSDEKNPDEWRTQFNNLINSLPDDTLLSLYDCHI